MDSIINALRPQPASQQAGLQEGREDTFASPIDPFAGFSGVFGDIAGTISPALGEALNRYLGAFQTWSNQYVDQYTDQAIANLTRRGLLSSPAGSTILERGRGALQGQLLGTASGNALGFTQSIASLAAAMEQQRQAQAAAQEYLRQQMVELPLRLREEQLRSGLLEREYRLGAGLAREYGGGGDNNLAYLMSSLRGGSLARNPLEDMTWDANGNLVPRSQIFQQQQQQQQQERDYYDQYWNTGPWWGA